MRQRAGVEEEPLEGPAGRADAIEEGALVIRLERGDRRAELAPPLRQPLVDAVQRLFAVDLGLAGPEQLQVRPRKDENPEAFARFFQASSAMSFGAQVRIR